MKTIKLFNLCLLAAMFIFTFTGCKKDSTTPGSSSAAQIATAQDAESQDAMLIQVEQGADTQIDALESSNFALTDAVPTKTTLANGVTIEINHPDTIIFPKTVYLNYNFIDTVNGEVMSQTGSITIVIDTVPVYKKLWWRKHVSRSYTFNNFTVANDSSSVTINGTRNMKRLNWLPTVSDNNLKLRVEVKDTIYSSFEIGITCGDYSGSYTRNLNRTRDIKTHYYRMLAINKVWHPSFTDTLTFLGSITGVNLQDSIYSRVITKPLEFTLCPVWPHNLIASGQVTDTEGSKITTINYTPNGCKTTITATDANGNTVKLDRKINRKYKNWWK